MFDVELDALFKVELVLVLDSRLTEVSLVEDVEFNVEFKLEFETKLDVEFVVEFEVVLVRLFKIFSVEVSLNKIVEFDAKLTTVAFSIAFNVAFVPFEELSTCVTF